MRRKTDHRLYLSTVALFVAALSVALAAKFFTAGPDDHKVHHPKVVTPSTGHVVQSVSPSSSVTGAAYLKVSSGLPGLRPEEVHDVRQSVLDPGWASVLVSSGEPGGYYAVFLHRQDGLWYPRRSVLVQRNPDPEKGNPRDIESVLENIPEDLKRPLLTQEASDATVRTPRGAAASAMERGIPDGHWKVISTTDSGPYRVIKLRGEKGRTTRVYLKRSGSTWEARGIGEHLTRADLPDFPKSLVSPAPVPSRQEARVEPARIILDGHPDRKRIMPGLKQALRYVKRYPGTAGFYVIDLKSGAGYGVRPDEPFFSASVIKVAVMVAVFRRMDEGRLSYSERLAITPRDKAPGSGELRWEPVGRRLPIRDYLWLMITRSDNVATNVLTRAVGGRDYVNRVARSLGARHTVLYQKLSDNRAAVPSLDNRTTPRDMARLLAAIYEGRAASHRSCRRMIYLLRHNDMEWWMEAGVPPDVKVANKGGWLDSTFNDAGIVLYRRRPYVLAIFTKYGTNDIQRGGDFLADVSKSIWRSESGESLTAYERQELSGRTQASPR